VALLDVRDLSVTYPGDVPALRAVSLRVAAGEAVGLAGRSGSGKTTLAHAVLRLLPPGTAVHGDLCLDGEDVRAMTWGRLRAVRWTGAAVVFQGSVRSLDPLRPVGAQIGAPMRRKRAARRAEVPERVADLLRRVELDGDLAQRYPHELSGGQRQRVLIAMALSCSPRLVIADEPTASLDVLARAEILRLLAGIVRDDGGGLLMISHDLAALSAVCERVVVLDDGVVVEHGGAAGVTATARAESGAGRPAVRPGGSPLLSAQSLQVCLPARGRAPGRAVIEGVDLDVHRGEAIALVGEVGAGKTTLGRALAGLVRPAAGDVRFEAEPLRYRGRNLRRHRARVQYVPQDGSASLNPRHPVGRAVGEGLVIRGHPAGQVRDVVAAALELVGLDPPGEFRDRYPHQLSAGQCQRVALAAALALRPQVLIADEPIAPLDAATRRDVLGVLRGLRDNAGMATVLITHDLAAARHFADRVVVMRGGAVVESGPVDHVLGAPEHPYTRALVGAAEIGAHLGVT
jgi:peptide/nickel transport system ATP-binding protein